jgi:hypothetical protein
MAVNKIGITNNVDFNGQINQVTEQKKIVVGDNSVKEKGSVQEKLVVNSGESQKFALNNTLDNTSKLNKSSNVTQIASLPEIGRRPLAPQATANPSNLSLRREQQFKQELFLRVSIPSPKNNLPEIPNGTYQNVQIRQQFSQQALRNNPNGVLVSYPAGSNESHILAVKPLNDVEKKVLERAEQLKFFIGNTERKLIDARNAPNAAQRRNEIQAYAADITKAERELFKYKNIDEYKNRERLSSSSQYNGQVFKATAEGADPKASPVIFVNGVNTDIGRSGTEALEISDLAKAPVLHIANVSDLDHGQRISEKLIKGDKGNVEGQLSAITRSILVNPPAATQTANAILDQLDKTQGVVRIVGYSQGGAIVAEALRHVEGEILARRDSGKITAAQANNLVSRIQILGIAPAAVHRDIPDVFRNNYRIIYDKGDVVPKARGLGIDGKTNNILDLGSISGESKKKGGLSEHLSYFRHYETTDASSAELTRRGRGVEYNEYAGREITKWLNISKNKEGGGYIVELDQRNPNQRSRYLQNFLK